MEFIKDFIDVILHLDTHLVELVSRYGTFSYAILFAIIFCETGLVVTPFLPGDSLLFAIGALSAKGALDVYTAARSEEHTSELQSRPHLVCRLLLEKKKL